MLNWELLLAAGKDGKAFDDCVSSHFSSHQVELLCIDDISSKNVNEYHHSSNVYAGGSSFDIVDDTFHEVELGSGELKAHYKFDRSNQFLWQIPLSSAFLDSSFRKFKLSSDHARLFIGKN